MQAIERIPAGDQALRVGLAHAGIVRAKVDGHRYACKAIHATDHGFRAAAVILACFGNEKQARGAHAAHAAAPVRAATV